MPTIKTYSSVSIVDGLDFGQLQAYLTCNHPTNVVYDPNTNTYTPNWLDNPLVITPVISYNGQQLGLTSEGLTIVYSCKEGDKSPFVVDNSLVGLVNETKNPLQDGGENLATTPDESVSNGILTVTANKLSNNKIVTYICDITYTDPKAGLPITTQVTMSFTLLATATELKYAYITGENAFLYNSDRNIVGANTITLSSDISSNLQVIKWQYLNANNQYVDFANSSSETLVVKADDSNIWVNGRIATIKLVTSDQDVFDIHQVIKIYDGAAGNSTVSVVLSNQSQYLPCNENGEIIGRDTEQTIVAQTKIYVYEGGVDVTDDWTITYTVSNENELTGTFNDDTNTFGLLNLTSDTGYVDFTCTRDLYSPLHARFTVTKVRAGADGKSPVIYELSPDTYVINISEDETFYPSSATFYSYKIEGTSKELSPKYFVLAESTDGTTYSNINSGQYQETSKTYYPSSTSVAYVRCRLYGERNGNTYTNLLDEQTIVITRDGISGDSGIDGLSVGLVNNQDVIPCKETGHVNGEKNIIIPFYAYMGITRIPVVAYLGILPDGISLISNTPGTDFSDGQIVLDVADNATLGDLKALSGEINIKLNCDLDALDVVYQDENEQTLCDELNNVLSDHLMFDYVYTWHRNLKGVDGENTNILQIYSDDGGVIRNSEGQTTLKARYVCGAQEVIPDSIQWKKFQGAQYVNISGATSLSLIVDADMVDDLAIFKAVASYEDVECEAFYTVDDLTDPIMAHTTSTVREFKNGEGCGAVYTRLYRNDGEVDPLKSLVFTTTLPTNPSNGDYCYHLNPQANTQAGKCVLKQWNGSSWVNADENYLYTYKYYKINKDGVTSTDVINQRCVYIDAEMIHSVGDVIQFICEVEE